MSTMSSGTGKGGGGATTYKKEHDRWAASSSEDESDNDHPKRKERLEESEWITRKKQQREDNSTQSAPLKKHDLPIHNPLLQGCRSVYDTYERIQRVSEGTYGVVWKARCLATGQDMALKQIKFHALSDSSSFSAPSQSIWKEGFPVSALREINVLLALTHENIVSVHEMVVGDDMDKVFMAMEFFECDLKVALRQASDGGPLAQSELKGILQQILAGTEHMHSKWYIHRDLKPSNILVKMGNKNQGGRIALADFGLARRYQEPAFAMTLPVVTLWYRAPELLFGESCYGPAVDMWSIGCIMGELIKSGCSSINKSVDPDDYDDSNAILKGQGELDQIDQIFSLLGVPNNETWPSFDKLPNANLLRWKNVVDIQLPLQFPIAASTSSRQTFLDANGYNMLQSFLTLDPSKRLTATSALHHDYFVHGVAPKIPHFFTSTIESL